MIRIWLADKGRLNIPITSGNNKKNLFSKGGIPVSLQKQQPVLIAEMEAAVMVSDFFERTQQARHVVLFPRTGLAETTPVKIDKEDLLLSIQKNVVGVEIGVKDIGLVEAPDAAADGQPDGCRLRHLLQQIGQGASRNEAFGNNICPIDTAARYHTGGNRSGNRKPLGIERGQQTPFTPRARTFRAHSQILVMKNFSDQATTPVVPQHPFLPVLAEKIGFATTKGFADQKAACGQLHRIKNIAGRL